MHLPHRSSVTNIFHSSVLYDSDSPVGDSTTTLVVVVVVAGVVVVVVVVQECCDVVVLVQSRRLSHQSH